MPSKFYQANLQEREHQGGLGVDGRTMNLKEININTRYWVDSGQDRGYWRALANSPE